LELALEYLQLLLIHSKKTRKQEILIKKKKRLSCIRSLTIASLKWKNTLIILRLDMKALSRETLSKDGR